MKHYGLDIPEGEDITNLTAPTGTSFPNGAAGDPPNSGELFFRTDLGKLYCYVSGSPGQWVDLSASSSGSSSTPNTKNAIINGNFDIWQRGTSQTNNGYGSDDHWINSHVGSTKTHSRQSFAPGQTDVPGNPDYFSRTVVTSVAGAANFVKKNQRIEGVATFAGETITISFYAKADASKNIAVAFTQNFGAGGSPAPSAAVSGIGAQTIALTTSWQKITVTVSIPSINGKTLGTDDNDYLAFQIWFDAGSNFNTKAANLGQQSGTFDIAQVQIEKGSTATDFERRTIAEELALCQRYYEKSYDLETSPGSLTYAGAVESKVGGGYIGYTCIFKTRKRAVPTLTFYNPATGSSGSWRNINNNNNPAVALTGVGAGQTSASCAGAGNDNNVLSGHWTADAEI